MKTQTATAALNKAGFKAFRVYAKNVNGVYTKFREGDFNAFKVGNVIGVETYGKNTAALIDALAKAGITSEETKPGSGLIKIK